MTDRDVGHVTVKLIGGLPSLRRGQAFKEVWLAIARVNAKGLIRIVEFSVQSNHVHMLIEAANSADLSRGMASLNSGLGRRLNVIWGRVGMGSVLQERFHLEVIDSPRRMRNALIYVLRNDVHHGMGLKTLDPCSSAPFFRGWTEYPNQPAASTDRRVNARPEQWLLKAGWKKLGGKREALLSIHKSPSIAKGVRIQALEA